MFERIFTTEKLMGWTSGFLEHNGNYECKGMIQGRRLTIDKVLLVVSS